MSDDHFFERLRRDAAPLRYEADDVTVARMAARIRARVAEPTIADLLARWFRPLTATLTAIALAAVIGLTVVNDEDASTLAITFAGESYSVLD
jgi:hypothetical protein